MFHGVSSFRRLHTAFLNVLQSGVYASSPIFHQPCDTTLDFLARVKAHCDTRGITFLCTAHDEHALAWLDDMDVDGFKIGSGEHGNIPFIIKMAERGKPVFLSTGMYDAADVVQTVNAVADTGLDALAILHCVTSYPVPANQVNLLAVEFLAGKLPVPVGYSDHTAGHSACLGAVALGARVIEKHITLEFDIPNAQDWKVSCGPDDFADFVAGIRRMEAMLGTAEKRAAPCEDEGKGWARKRLIAARDLEAGTVMTLDLLAAKRAGSGFLPDHIEALEGRVLVRPVAVSTPVEERDLADDASDDD